jgi:outer membrane lipoprotein-sorting protein
VKKPVHKKKNPKKIVFNQKGKSKLILIIAAVVVLLGAGGFYVLSQKTGVSIPGMKAALNPNCEYKDPDLCKFLNNWANQKDYSVTSTSKFGGVNMESLYEVSGTDKYHMVSKSGGKELSNVINIGDTTYTLDYSDNQWWKQTVKVDETKPAVEEEIKNDFDLPESKDTTTYKLSGKEACGDRTCFKYELVDTSSTAQTKQFIWFDDRDYLIRKMVIEDKENGSMESVYSYDNINISEPSPVKEGTPGAGAGMGQYSEEEAKKMMEQYNQQMPDTSSYDQETPVDSSEY